MVANCSRCSSDRDGHYFDRRACKEVEKVSIGENLKRMRLKCGMTQTELARKVNVDNSLICQFERGTKAPSLPLSKEIAEALHCEISDLVG